MLHWLIRSLDAVEGLGRRFGFSSDARRLQHRRTLNFDRPLSHESLENRHLLATIAVDTLVDEADGDIVDGDVSLRDALRHATDGTEIVFDASLNGGAIRLTMGQLEITNILSIDATSLPDGLTIDASGNDPTPDEDNGDGSRVLYINPTNDLQVTTISGLTITGGDVTGRGGGIGSPYFAASVRIHSSIITGNAATEHGGGVAVSGKGSLDIYSTVISDNTAGNNGGGIRTNDLKMFDSVVEGNEALDGGGIAGFSLIRVVRSTISGNVATGFGGGINSRFVKIDASTLSFNDADLKGGGINGSIVEARNSTISNNSAGDQGGGILADEFELESVTITKNSADVGGGLFRKDDEPFDFVVRNSILADNVASSSPDFKNVVFFPFEVASSFIGDNSGSGISEAPIGSADENGNLVGDPSGAGTLSPKLTQLAKHGGPTQTHSPIPGSPVINMGDAGLEVLNDQRGSPFARTVGRVDMGALEYQTAVINYAEDEVLNCSDVDFLVGSIVAGEQDKTLDLTGDSVIDKSDVDVWLQLGGIENLRSHQSYPQGDANLDGRIDSEDLNAVGLNWQSSVRGWCQGDFDLDGAVDGGDLNLIGIHWLTNASLEEAVKRASLGRRSAEAPRSDGAGDEWTESDSGLNSKERFDATSATSSESTSFDSKPLELQPLELKPLDSAERKMRNSHKALAKRRQTNASLEIEFVDSVMVNWRRQRQAKPSFISGVY